MPGVSQGPGRGRRGLLDRGTRRQSGADLDDAVDAHLAACPSDTAGKQRSTGGQEAAVADTSAVDVRMRPDQNIVTDHRRMPRAARAELAGTAVKGPEGVALTGVVRYRAGRY
jgi:hypothetical protein